VHRLSWCEPFAICADQRLRLSPLGRQLSIRTANRREANGGAAEPSKMAKAAKCKHVYWPGPVICKALFGTGLNGFCGLTRRD
jgi:hypothetical protein